MKSTTILCPATLTISMLSSKWKAHVLAHLGTHPTGIRFGELARLIPGISRRMLTHSLQELVEDGFVVRTEFLQIPLKVVYTLTELGREVQPVIDALARFGGLYLERKADRIEKIYGSKMVTDQLAVARHNGWI